MPTKTVHYRKFDPVTEAWTFGTLESLLVKALRSPTGNGANYLSDWRSRKFSVLSDLQLIRFAHSISISEDAIFGTLCLFLPDDWAIVLKQVENNEREDHARLDKVMAAIEVAERPPLAGEDYLRGIAYWLVVGDHLFVVQHTSIQTKAFEEYFYQLLVDAKMIAEVDKFALRSEFDKSSVGGDLGEITSVKIGGVVSRDIAPPQTMADEAKFEDVEEQKTIGRRVTRFEKAWDVLKAVFGDPNAETILASMPSDAELEVDVRFGYKTKSRKLSREALGDIARAARNLPDGEVVAYGKNGTQMGNDLRLSMPMPFKLVRDNGALLDLDDARLQLLRVYQRFVEDGKIEK